MTYSYIHPGLIVAICALVLLTFTTAVRLFHSFTEWADCNSGNVWEYGFSLVVATVQFACACGGLIGVCQAVRTLTE